MNWQSGECWSNAVKDSSLNPNCDTKLSGDVNPTPAANNTFCQPPLDADININDYTTYG